MMSPVLSLKAAVANQKDTGQQNTLLHGAGDCYNAMRNIPDRWGKTLVPTEIPLDCRGDQV